MHFAVPQLRIRVGLDYTALSVPRQQNSVGVGAHLSHGGPAMTTNDPKAVPAEAATSNLAG